MRQNGMYRIAALILASSRKLGLDEFDRSDLEKAVVTRAKAEKIKRKDMPYSFSVALTLLCDAGYLAGKNSKPNGRHRGPYCPTQKAVGLELNKNLSTFYDEIRGVHRARTKGRPIRLSYGAEEVQGTSHNVATESPTSDLDGIYSELTVLKADIALLKAAITRLLK